MELTSDQAPIWPCSSVAERLHRNCKGHGFECRRGLKILFRFLLQLLQFLNNCDDYILFNPLTPNIKIQLLLSWPLIFL